jgi:hypothetical protein
MRWLMLVLLAAVQTRATARPVEVVVVATEHFITDMPEGYTPAHLRALLTKIQPDLLLVEAPANAQDPWPGRPTSWRR